MAPPTPPPQHRHVERSVAEQRTEAPSQAVSPQSSADEDAISEMSTASSDGARKSALRWTDVAARKRGKPPQAAAAAPRVVLPRTIDAKTRAPRQEPPLRQEAPVLGRANSASSASDIKGKGLSHFVKIDVGIKDDPNFRVVQRLIGPRGKHMQDILAQAKGAKLWMIGKGSRSWEDDSGPLVICVGASTSDAFETALRLVNELLAGVREEHQKFHRAVR